jgi:CRISPR-associated RAMP protein (TIGR02581 family)
MFDVFCNRLEISGTLTTITALRIGAGRSLEPISTDVPVVKDVLGKPYIPGASFKGALRSRLESFLRAVLGNNPKLVANPAIEEEWSLTSKELKQYKDERKQLTDQELTSYILGNTDLISKLFGSPWFASKFQVRDLQVLDGAWFGQYLERDGVSIDRDTETAADGKLYNFQVVPAGTPFSFRAVVENAEKWELGLLMIGLHQFETEQITLGGGASRGLGVVKLEIDKLQWFDSNKDPKKLLDYLQRLVAGDVDAYEDATSLRNQWVQALMEELRTKLTSQAESAHKKENSNA